MRLSPTQSARLSSQLVRRTQSQSLSSQNDDIFTDSLRKTLDAHRASNRARLIRKVYPRHDPPGLFRPYIPPENRAGYQPPSPPQSELPAEITEPASSDQTPTTAIPVTTATRRSRSRSRKQTPEFNSAAHPRPEDHAIHSVGAVDSGRVGQLPWLRYVPATRGVSGPGTHSDASAYLDAEIHALHRYLSPTPAEQGTITRLGGEISSLLESVVPSTPLLIGSRRTGLALAHSDLDFLLPFKDSSRSWDRARRPSPNRPQIRDAHLTLLRRVEQKLREIPAFQFDHRSPSQQRDKKEPDSVYLSRWPSLVLEARHRPTGLLLQFYCGEDIPALTEYIQDYLVEYPSLAPLYTSARILLEARGLFGSPRAKTDTDTRTRTEAGISPDALLMLLVAFSKLHHGRFPGPHRLGDQFLAFLKLYGRDIDFRTTGVAVDPPGFFNAKTISVTTPPPSSSLTRPKINHSSTKPTPSTHVEIPAALRGQRSLLAAKRTAAARGNFSASRRLCVQDPTHYMNDLGRSCTRTAQIQSAFADAYEQLQKGCDMWEYNRSGPGSASGPASKNSNSTILGMALRARFDGLERIREGIVKDDGC